MPSSSLFSYNEPSCRSRNGRNSGCISRILRRILCFNTLPSTPFDRLKEEQKETLLEFPSSTPGLVARLMGLDSLPRVEPIDESPSINSADSCKIIPRYQELEDENFFILSFECESSLMNYEKKKERKRKKIRKLKRESLHESDEEHVEVNKVSKGNSNDSDFKVEDISNGLSPMKNFNQKSEKMMKKKMKKDKLALINLEIEDDSENSSPNSVLDFVEFQAAPETACPGDISRLSNSKLRRKLCEEIENCRKSKEKKMINEEEKNSRLRNKHQNYEEKWDEIVKLAAREMVKLSWVNDEISKNRVYFEEIGRDIASEILDQLISEVFINSG